MSEFDAELADIFRDEAVRRLDEMDAALLAIESGEPGTDPVDSLFRNAHTIKGAAGMVGFDDIRALAHAVEDVLASVRESGVFPPELAAPLLRATAVLRAQVTGVGAVADDELLDDLAAALVPLSARGASRHRAGPGPPAGPDTAGSLPAGTPSAAPPPAGPRPAAPGASEADSRRQDGHQAGQEPGRPEGEHNSLRVPAEKIDHLLDVVGELMQFRGQLGHALGRQQQLSQHAADVLTSGERLLSDLKDTAIGMRTLPLAVITRRLPRAVRDLARATGKEVEFVVTGADTELDRVIIESLYEPLTHLLRNAVVHGIESPADRESAGKPARGHVELRAVPHGSLVEIVVTDDGRGISRDVIERARQEGSLADVLAQPGYSTAADVTDLAGRGVGLDAVRSHVQALGGSLEIRSEPGHGLDVGLMLPLAIALVEVMLFERAGAVYGVPLVVVEEIVTAAKSLPLGGRPAMEVDGRPVPVADIAALIGAGAPPAGDRPPALVISVGGRRLVASCDRVLGAEEVVIKPPDPLHSRTGSYLGAAILGDGRIALILEPAMLARSARHIPATDTRPAADPVSARVLVVEDSFTVRELQRSILEAAGYPVVTARSGREALQALGRDTGIALVVTDLEMPDLDGLDLTRAIRADRSRSSLPVIIVTARGSDEDRRKGLDAGADAYMAKQNFDQQTLLAMVEQLIGR